MCILISQGILCKPRKDKKDDPAYPEFSAAIKEKEQDYIVENVIRILETRNPSLWQS